MQSQQEGLSGLTISVHATDKHVVLPTAGNRWQSPREKIHKNAISKYTARIRTTLPPVKK